MRQHNTSDAHQDEPLLTFGGMVAPDAPISAAPPEMQRTWAISQYMAALADNQDYPTQRFRLEHLPDGKPLAPDAIEAWIKGVGSQEGQSGYLDNVPSDAFQHRDDGWLLPKVWVDAILSGNGYPKLGGGIDTDTWGSPDWRPQVKSKMLWYVTPHWGDRSVFQNVRAGGVLDELWRVAENLADTYTWDMDRDIEEEDERHIWGVARATSYVLCGYAPLIDERLFRWQMRRGKGVHPQTAKHLQLAVFTKRHEGLKIAERMEEWNALYPEWAYTRATNFGWDSKQAMRRLIPSEDQQNVLTPSEQEWNTALLEADRQQETEGDEGATVLWAFEVPQFVVEAKLEPEHAYTAEEYKMISEEKKRQMGGRKSAVWTGEEARLLEDAKRRREAEKSEKDEG